MSIDPEEITRLVRSVVARTLGDKGREVRYQKDAGASRRKIITEEHVREMLSGTEQLIPPNAIVTPLALQIAQERRIRLIKDHTQASISYAAASEPAGQRISSPQHPQKSPDGRHRVRCSDVPYLRRDDDSSRLSQEFHDSSMGRARLPSSRVCSPQDLSLLIPRT